MATSEFVEVAACANAVEAEYLRSLLEESGVSAFVDGAAANTALSHIGTALGGVRLLVRAADATQAREIVEEGRAGSEVSAEAWFCGACRESVDGAFGVCWSCGRDRASAERPFPPMFDGDHVEPACNREGAPADTPIPDLAAYDGANPYASPMTRETATPSQPQAEINEAAEAMLQRAWRASIIGIVLFPFLLHLYSTYLLIRAATTAAAFSREGERRFYQSIVINLIAGGVCGMLIRFLLG